MLIRLSQPTGLFVALSDVKPHAVIDFDDDDDLLESYIKAATRFVEDRTGRILLPIDLEYRVAGWSEPICLPAFPVREVTEVVYLDEDHAEQTLDDGDWYLSETEEGGEIRFTDAFASPSLSDRPLPVRVRFSAGYDDPAASGSGDDPALQQDEMDRQIVRLMVAHSYANREAVGGAMNSVPLSAESLIEMRRIFR
ncbi:MAG: phage head-tail connector protein [Rhodobiaceae bacterium]|nr:head-tail connector protein [Rhodobiaceae bacterium]MCC0055909.1 phage head-tail connector protein [Rhodobiaceae bacterium]